MSFRADDLDTHRVRWSSLTVNDSGGVVARTNQNGPEQVVNDLTEGIGAEPAFGGEVEGVVVGLGDGVFGDVVDE